MNNNELILLIFILAIFIVFSATMIACFILLYKSVNKIDSRIEFMFNDYRQLYSLRYKLNKDDLALLDTIINESLNEYKILNFEYENNIYIKEDEINKMVASVLKNVLTKMSPLFLDKLSYIYNKNVLEDEILKKVRFSVLAYVTEVNGNYKG